MPSTPQQLIDQATRHAVYLERYKSGAVNDYIALLKKMRKAVISELDGEITDWNRTRLNKQLAAIRASLKDASSPIEDVMRKQVAELASYEAEFETRSLDSVTVNYQFDVPSDNQLISAVYSQPLQVTGPYQGELLETYIADWSKNTIKRVNGAIRLGFAQGKTTQQLIRDLDASDGAFSQSRRDWENIVRTGLAHTANESRQATWKANSDIVKAYRIVATIDSGTTATCRSLDTKEFPLGKGPVPPFHVNCRTTTVAVLDKRFAILDKGGTRSARDPKTGDVISISSKESYYGWLKRQPVKVQDSIVGPTRGQLMRNGGLTSERFAELQIGKQFEPLTLDEMRKLEPVAFETAGL